MTRKDYVLIAEAMRTAYNDVHGFTHGTEQGHKKTTELAFAYAVHSVAKAMQADNPRFDANRFIVACGLGELVGA